MQKDAVLAKLCDDDGSACDGHGELGLKAFLKDMRRRFPGLDDVYMWQVLCSAWGGVCPGTTSPWLAGTMDDLPVDRILKGGIGLVRPD